MLAFLRKHQNLKSVALRLNDVEIDSPPDSMLESLTVIYSSPNRPYMEKLNLPPLLTRFESSKSIVITADRLESLPRTITELLSINLDWSSLVQYQVSMGGPNDASLVRKLWPPQLRVLELADFRVPDQGTLDFFPPSLEHLTGVNLGEVINRGYPTMRISPLEWPFEVSKLRLLALMHGSLSFTNGMPVYLTHLEMKIWTEKISTLKCLSPSSIRTLKLSFQSQSNYKKRSASELLSALPTGLTSLDLDFTFCELDWDSVDWSRLPAPLIALKIHSQSLRCVDRWGDEAEGLWWLWNLKSHQILPYLPASLQRLDISLNEVNACDILAMPCYYNLKWFSMAWAHGYGEAPFMPSDEIADAWPSHADSNFRENWGNITRTKLQRKLDAAKKRGHIFPDPRVTTPGQALEY